MRAMNRDLKQYLKKHDVACAYCGYNLRGIRKLICPECGVDTSFRNLDELVEELRLEYVVEENEFGFYLWITKCLTWVLMIDGILAISLVWSSGWKQIVPVGLFFSILAGSNFWIRQKIFVNSISILPFHKRKLDLYRDIYGSLTLTALIAAVGLGGFGLLLFSW